MSRKVQEEKANGKDIEGHVSKWQNDVEEIQKSDDELSPSCSCIRSLPIPNPASRFRLGRNAAEKAKTVAQLKDSGKEYLTGEIAHLPAVKNLPKPDATFKEFQSREEAYRKLWDALVDNESPLIHGIYGMAGVGKTRMMEKNWEDAMEKKLFDKVVRVNVGSEDVDKTKLQDKIAARLDCHLDSQDVETRSSQLGNSLRNWNKVLLVFDDVWRDIHLDHIIGTSLGDGSSSGGSKILFTSRKEDVCRLNNCKHIVEIKTLSPSEALYLFKNVVGPDTINSLLDKSLVQKLCDKCGHLPLLIHAVGKALKSKPDILWKDAHDQLMKGKFDKLAGVDPHVYAGIELSIDKLEYADAKWCLFLCSLFPEDTDIDMEILVHLAIGSQLIPDGETRILAMVEHLKKSSLLLDSGSDDETKVHDVIRDVARSIAFSKHAFLQVTCTSKYLPSDANYCTRKVLRLDAETDGVHFDEHPLCPDLHILWLQGNDHLQKFSGGFFNMFANLSFLMLQDVKISAEQFSLQPLDNLGTLILLTCNIFGTDVRLFPTNLKTLRIWYCDLPSPLDLGNLKYLRKLEIQQRRRHVSATVNIISCLSSVQELHIPEGFIIDNEEYQMESLLPKISELKHLTSLRFHFYYNDTFQGKTDIFSKLDRYNIFVGPREGFDLDKEPQWRDSSTRSIELCGTTHLHWEGLMARAEKVSLIGIDIVEMSRICKGHRRAFEDLKRLYIYECHEMGYLARYDNLQSATCFSMSISNHNS